MYTWDSAFATLGRRIPAEASFAVTFGLSEVIVGVHKLPELPDGHFMDSHNAGLRQAHTMLWLVDEVGEIDLRPEPERFVPLTPADPISNSPGGMSASCMPIEFSTTTSVPR